MTIKLICIDMDSTLLRDDKSYDESAFKQAALSLMDQGVVICIASGNVDHRLRSYFDDELKDRLYFAADNGNYLVKNDQVIHAISVERQDMEEIMDQLADHPDFHISISTGDDVYVLKDDMDDFVKEKFSIYYDRYIAVDDFRQIPHQAPLCKIAMWTEQSLEENKALAQTIRDQYPQSTSVTSGGSWMDVYHVEGGKGAAVRYLQDKYELACEETVSFGDSLNDASMMEESAYRVAVANADPDLKALCNYEIGSNQDQAVSRFLTQLADADSLDFMQDYRIEEA